MYLFSYYKNGFYCEEILDFRLKSDYNKYFKLKKSYEKGYIQDLNIRKV